MKTSLLAAIAVLATIASSTVLGESIFSNIYMAADMGTITAPSFIGTNRISETPKVALGIQPKQGWGGELGVIEGSSSCGCVSPYSPTGTLILPTANKLTRVDVYELFGTYTQPVNDWIALSGKFGFAHTDYSAELATGLTVRNASTNIGGGVGLQVKVFKKFGLRFQYEEMRTANYVTGINRLRYVSAGWVLRFH